MKFIEIIDVNEALIDSIWDRIKDVGSFYSIGDGASRETFSRVMYGSSAVLKIQDGFIRAEDNGAFVELHPIFFGHSAFRQANGIMDEITKLFHGKNICCIIPSRMESAMDLALKAGMHEIGTMHRELSGVPVVCTVFIRRNKDVQQH